MRNIFIMLPGFLVFSGCRSDESARVQSVRLQQVHDWCAGAVPYLDKNSHSYWWPQVPEDVTRAAIAITNGSCARDCYGDLAAVAVRYYRYQEPLEVLAGPGAPPTFVSRADEVPRLLLKAFPQLGRPPRGDELWLSALYENIRRARGRLFDSDLLRFELENAAVIDDLVARRSMGAS